MVKPWILRHRRTSQGLPAASTPRVWRWVSAFAVGSLIAALAVAVTVDAPPASAAGCTSTTLVPTAHMDTFAPASQQFMVNQGLPVYSNSSTDTSTNLVRGKDTLLRVFLSLPSCAGSNQSVTVTNATASVTWPDPVTGKTATLASGLNAFSPTGSFSLPKNYTGAPPPNASTDPTFMVPGADLAPIDSTASFAATFAITLKYTNSFTTTPVTQPNPFTAMATVAKKSNALRILVVPMGAGTALTSSQYSSSASAAVDQAMNSLSRIYPVPCDANPTDPSSSCYSNSITSAFGGIRYSVDPATLDLTTISGAYDSNGKFCGGQTNWNAIDGQLQTLLGSYNNPPGLPANPNPADRVVGVVDQAISDGVNSSPSGFACADGMSSAGATAAWARALYTSQPSSSGGIIAMELEHTFGGVPFPRSTTYHSLNSAADGTAPTRAYNMTQRSQIGTSRSVMKYDTTSPWNNNTTVQEQLDDQFVLCNLGGPADSECTTPGSTGTTNGIAAGVDTFVMSGSTQNTMATTNVVMSYYGINDQPTSPDPRAPLPSSSYRLVQTTLDGTTIVNDVGVATSILDSAHNSTSNNQGLTPTAFNFSVAVPGFSGVGRIDFYWCGTSPTAACQYDPAHKGGTLLYERVQQSNPPTVTAVSTTAAGDVRDFSNNHSVDDINPAIHGNLVAWVAPCLTCNMSGVSTIHLAPTSGAPTMTEIPLTVDPKSGLALTQGDPAWKPDGSAVVFDAGGNLYTATVSFNPTPTPQWAVGTPALIWQKGQAAADTPTWSPDSATNNCGTVNSSCVYFHSSAGGLDAVSPLNCGTSGCSASPIVNSPSHEQAPSASPSDPKSLAYVATTSTGCAAGAATCSGLFIIDPTAKHPGQTSRQITTNASQPFFGDNGQVTFTGDSTKPGLWSVAAAGGSPTQLTSNANDANSSESSGLMAFDRPLPDREIMLANLSTNTVTANVTSPSPNLLTGELDLKCPSGEIFPLKVGIPPTSTTSASAQFAATFDGSGACSGNITLTFRASDGFTLSSPTTASELQVTNPSRPPVASITSPTTGAVYSSTGTIPLNGSGTSSQDGALTGASLKWFAGTTQVGTGNVVDAVAPQGGWPVGPLTITLQATDSSGRMATATTQITITSTPPITTATVSPQPNAAGWNNSTVTVTLNATAPGSGVKQITYTLSGAQASGPTTVAGSTASFTVSSAGTTTVSYYATDNAGNVEPTEFLQVNIDETAPTLTIVGAIPTNPGQAMTGTATDDASGVASVTVMFFSNVTKKTITEAATCSPACGPGAGVPPALPVTWRAPVPPPTTKNGQTDNFTVSATAIDVAGNTGTAVKFPTPVNPS